MKLGRNDPCWCGSGWKYKRCHLDRSRQKPVNPWHARRQREKVFERKYCLHPLAGPDTCDKTIVRAHTVQRGRSLTAIARSGHVYRAAADIDAVRMRADLIGIKEASTFHGFCARHDCETFAPIETRAFENTPEQCFLLTYRVLLMEVYLKRCGLEAMKIAREADRGCDMLTQLETQDFVGGYAHGLQSGLNSMDAHRRLYDSDLLAHDFTQIRSVTVNFARVPDLVCSGFVNPEYDFNGRLVQNCMTTERLDGLGFSMLAHSAGGVAVFAWREDSDQSCVPLLESFLSLPRARIGDALLRFAFENLENIFLSPTWWESLDSKAHAALEDRMMANLPWHPARPRGLVDDGEQYVNWPVHGIRETRQSGRTVGAADQGHAADAQEDARG
jgi:hypothetical protein